MPRLVLYEDDGRVLFQGNVSRANVEIVARFLRRNMNTLRVIAGVKRGLEAAVLNLLSPTAAPAPPRRRRRAS